MLPNGGTRALELSYEELLEVCDLLEGIADGLPQADARACIAVADRIEPLLERTHGLEEDILFPLLAASGRQELHHTVMRLRQEHLSDSCTAIEVTDALHDLAIGRSALSPDATGYLLRSFFDSMRRHVHGEVELLRLVRHEQHEGRLH